ncbi:FAD-binding oxidoreductase [Amycolatopsis acidiphila]|uniref:2Fe-2S iron-sulfur cluster binding domain-containing protein n=1 Tax=Amycolatopsis acidiphila TaxID=715473 RepID=A0A558ABR8_9PSEU|nr:2Fe-2S iron-sulfur cluster-binding protein [Amycolatopsis acidiphila]TVT21709.1 2Fe-2S iron-sulfur cluster binding domain-containing protein [Amycolatopsis acidiphila]UIJ59752.1 FAD-binding oxidoreductase [Amycolatopsis acidiphila]GHG98506.1 phenol hydroxylase P5 protein [Amycolatopsis acidiphila]
MSEVYTVTVDPLGTEVQCRADQPILDACLRAGVWLPHACTHGTCGTCKAEVTDGEVDFGEASSFALMDFEREEGKALLCCAMPRSDVTIEGDVELEQGITMHPVSDYTGTVVELSDCATDTRRLLLDLDREMAFNPGQYVSLEVPGTGQTRTYSMANVPAEPGRVELHIRRTPGGLATDNWIFKTLEVGDEIRLSGPYGRFFFRPARPEPMLMIAGGTGQAPITSIIRHALAEAEQRITLYAGGRTTEHLYNVALFRELQQRYPDRFHYRPCLSEQRAEGYAAGRVTDVLDAELDTCTGHVAYVCGPPPMVDATLKTLMRKRLFPRDIYREDFFDARDKATGGLRSPLLKR